MSFLTMQNAVLNHTRQSGTWATDRVKKNLNIIQEELARESSDSKQLEKESTATCVVGQKNYTLPSDFQRPLHVNLESGTSTLVVLQEVNWDAYRSYINTYTSNSEPSYYCVHYQQLWIAPAPDATYTLRMDFVYLPTEMTANGDTTPFPEYILEQGAKALFMKDLGREKEFVNDWQMYETYKLRYLNSEGRSPNRFDTWDTGKSGISPYWDGGKMGY